MQPPFIPPLTVPIPSSVSGVFDVLLPSERAEDSEGNPTQLELIEIADGVSVAEIQAATGCPFRVANGYGSRWLKPMMQVR